MTDLQLSDLNDRIAIIGLKACIVLAFITLAAVVMSAFLDSRTIEKRYKTDSIVMTILVIPYDFLRYIKSKWKRR